MDSELINAFIEKISAQNQQLNNQVIMLQLQLEKTESLLKASTDAAEALAAQSKPKKASKAKTSNEGFE